MTEIGGDNNNVRGDNCALLRDVSRIAQDGCDRRTQYKLDERLYPRDEHIHRQINNSDLLKMLL